MFSFTKSSTIGARYFESTNFTAQMNRTPVATITATRVQPIIFSAFASLDIAIVIVYLQVKRFYDELVEDTLQINWLVGLQKGYAVQKIIVKYSEWKVRS